MQLFFTTDNRSGIEPVLPKKLSSEVGSLNRIDGKYYISHSWREKRRLMAKGYVVQPSDCPPIRNLTKYGYQIFSAGLSIIEKHNERRERLTTNDCASCGFYTHSGDKCQISDSQFLSSWLANSEYVKVITGLVFLCPVGYGLYQGAIPYIENTHYEVLSAIEYSNSMGTYNIAGNKYFMVEANVVIKPLKNKIIIERNTPLAIIYPVLRPSEIMLDFIDMNIR